MPTNPTTPTTAALLTLAAGDALGAPAEFLSQADLHRRHGTLRDMTGGGKAGWAPGEWTDDTAMTLCVAEGILESPADPLDAIGRRFIDWRRGAKDVGNTIANAIDGFDGDWARSSRSTPQARSGKAAGNGSLMRTLPVTLAYADPEEMLHQSARISAMTHWDPQAEVCCALYCLWIRELLAGAPLRDGWRTALEQAKEHAATTPATPETPGPQSLPKSFWSRLENAPTIPLAEVQPSGYAGWVLECLEAVVRMLWEHEDTEECLVAIVNLAGEADTMAAIAGGALGVVNGAEALPERWLEVLWERERIERVGEAVGRLWNDRAQNK